MEEAGHEPPHHAGDRDTAALSPVLSHALRQLVRSEVIPRLKSSLIGSSRRATASMAEAAARGAAIDPQKVDALVRKLVRGDRLACVAIIDAMILDGASLERVFLKLLSPAALHVDQLHAEDFLGIAGTTVAICTLLGLLHHYAPDFRGEGDARDAGYRALLVSSDRAVDGLTLFGLCLISEFLRRDGWDVQIERDTASWAFEVSIASDWYDCIEIFSVRDGDVETLARAIGIVRRSALNRSVGISVCGNVLKARPAVIRRLDDRMGFEPPISATWRELEPAWSDLGREVTTAV